MPDLTPPSEIFAAEVQPAYQDFAADPLSERHAKNAARAVDHHLDWTFEYYDRTDQSRLLGAETLGGFRETIFGNCTELRMMNDISDAAHHRFLTRRVESRTVFTSTDSFVADIEELVVNNYNEPFLPALTTAVNFWRDWPD